MKKDGNAKFVRLKLSMDVKNVEFGYVQSIASSYITIFKTLNFNFHNTLKAIFLS